VCGLCDDCVWSVLVTLRVVCVMTVFGLCDDCVWSVLVTLRVVCVMTVCGLSCVGRELTTCSCYVRSSWRLRRWWTLSIKNMTKSENISPVNWLMSSTNYNCMYLDLDVTLTFSLTFMLQLYEFELDTDLLSDRMNLTLTWPSQWPIQLPYIAIYNFMAPLYTTARIIVYKLLISTIK